MPKRIALKPFVGISCEIVNDRLCYIGTSTGHSLFDPNGIGSLRAVSFLYGLNELRRTRGLRSGVFVWYAAARDVEYILRDCVNGEKDKLFSVNAVEREITRLETESDEAARLLRSKGGRVRAGALTDSFDVANIPPGEIKTFCEAIIAANAERLRELRRGACSGYQVEVRQGKSFRVWPEFADTAETKQARSVLIFDLFSFFGVPLFEAAREHLHENLPELDRSRADDLALFNTSIYQKYIQANAVETDTIARLGQYVDRTFRAAGVKLRLYYGPGSAASALLNKWEVKRHLSRQTEYNSPHKLLGAIDRAYHGGRMEAIQLGAIAGPVTVLDINSAYAAAMITLPDIAGARLAYVRRERVDPARFAEVGPHDLVRVEYDWGADALAGLLPFRTHRGVTTYRRAGRGWHWGVEVLAARAILPGCCEVLEKYVWKDAAPLPDTLAENVREFYAQRFAFPSEQAGLLKHALAALWGKFAQARGVSPYSSRVWAGMITAQVRAWLLTAADAFSADSVISFNVDALHVRGNAAADRSVDFPISDALGDWKTKTYTGGIYLAPGIYQLTGNVDKVATRGFSVMDFDNALDQLNERGFATLEQKYFAGYRLHTLAPDRYEYLSTLDYKIRLSPGTMAQRDYQTHAIKDWRADSCGSLIHAGTVESESAPPTEWLTHSGEFDSMLDIVQARRW